MYGTQTAVEQYDFVDVWADSQLARKYNVSLYCTSSTMHLAGR